MNAPVDEPMPPASFMAAGLLAAAGSTLIASSWQLATRHGVSTTLGPLDLALLRYGVPALCLLPWLMRGALWPRNVPAGVLVLVVAGGGLPFGLVVLAGAQWAPAAHMGVFMAGALPLFTALCAWGWLGERLTARRMAGLGLIAAAIGWMGLSNPSAAVAGAWRGDLLFLLAALLWALHSLAFRRCGLSPWQGAALINGWSFILLLPLIAFHGLPGLRSAPWPDIALQFVMQGLVAGVLGLATYLLAVARLGAARASLSAAPVPVLTALGAAWLLAEPVEPAAWVALALVVPGVVLASHAGRPQRQKEAGAEAPAVR